MSTQPTAEEPKPCYHPRSCTRCDKAGATCGAHNVNDPGHEYCTGRGPVPSCGTAGHPSWVHTCSIWEHTQRVYGDGCTDC